MASWKPHPTFIFFTFPEVPDGSRFFPFCPPCSDHLYPPFGMEHGFFFLTPLLFAPPTPENKPIRSIGLCWPSCAPRFFPFFFPLPLAFFSRFAEVTHPLSGLSFVRFGWTYVSVARGSVLAPDHPFPLPPPLSSAYPVLPFRPDPPETPINGPHLACPQLRPYPTRHFSDCLPRIFFGPQRSRSVNRPFNAPPRR